MKELKRMLEAVSDSYSDFVEGMLQDANNNETSDDLKLFISNHPNARTDQIIEYELALELLSKNYPELINGLMEAD